MLRIDQIVCMYHFYFRCASVSGSCSAFTFKLLDVSHFWRCFRGSHILTNLVVVWRSVLEELGQILSSLSADMEFVKNFTPSDFQEIFFTPSMSPNLNSFSKKKHKK